jgi:hypothetical protein
MRDSKGSQIAAVHEHKGDRLTAGRPAGVDTHHERVIGPTPERHRIWRDGVSLPGSSFA